MDTRIQEEKPQEKGKRKERQNNAIQIKLLKSNLIKKTFNIYLHAVKNSCCCPERGGHWAGYLVIH